MQWLNWILETENAEFEQEEIAGNSSEAQKKLFDQFVEQYSQSSVPSIKRIYAIDQDGGEHHEFESDEIEAIERELLGEIEDLKEFAHKNSMELENLVSEYKSNLL